MSVHSQIKVNYNTAHTAVKGDFAQLSGLIDKASFDAIEDVAKHTLVPAARKSIKTKLKKKYKTHMYKDGVPWESPSYRSKPGKPPIVHVLGKSLRSIIDAKPMKDNTVERFGYISPHGNTDLMNLACLLENGGDELESQWLANAYANPKFQKHVKQYQNRKAGVKRAYKKRDKSSVKKGTKKPGNKKGKKQKEIKNTAPWRKDRRYVVGEHWRQRRMSQKLLAAYDKARKTPAKKRTDEQKALLKEYRNSNPKKAKTPYTKPKHITKGNESWLLRKRLETEARKEHWAVINMKNAKQTAAKDAWMRSDKRKGMLASMREHLRVRRVRQEATERINHDFAQLAGKKHQHLRERKRFQHYVKNYGITKRSQMNCVQKPKKRKRYRNRKWNK